MSQSAKDLRPVITIVLEKRAESSGSEGVFVAAKGAHEDLSSVMVPIIGDAGLRALSSRAMHLAQREINADLSEVSTNDGTADAFNAWLHQHDPGRALEAAAAMLSALGGLLGTFIGDALTMRLLRKAWPDGFPAPESEETRS